MLKNILKTFLILAVINLISACSGPKPPSFKQLSKIELQIQDLNVLHLRGFVVFDNPNLVGASICRTNMQILIEDHIMSDIDQVLTIDIPPKSEFEVPFDVEMNMDMLKKENRNVLEGISKQILGNKLEIRYRGKVYFKIMGRVIGVPLDYKEKISLGLNREKAS